MVGEAINNSSIRWQLKDCSESCEAGPAFGSQRVAVSYVIEDERKLSRCCWQNESREGHISIRSTALIETCLLGDEEGCMPMTCGHHA